MKIRAPRQKHKMTPNCWEKICEVIFKPQYNFEHSWKYFFNIRFMSASIICIDKILVQTHRFPQASPNIICWPNNIKATIKDCKPIPIKSIRCFV